ncbi:MAG: hypothetical protein EPO40_21035 [Myxococcaceae bacterium]|nr:MAG: hypothetical protein EPO40_21035 [Myxococcaceae bacterium]
MWSTLRRVYWMIAVVLVSGCSGGGCSGCAGGAIAPIPGGYPLAPETRIPRAAQIRLSENGLNRIEAVAPGLLGGLVGSGIPVPTVSQNLTVGRAIVCPSGRCNIALSLPATGALDLSFADPNAINLRARIVISGDIPIRACVGSCNDSCGGTFCGTIASPTLNINTARGSHPYIGLSTKATIRRDTHAPRLNYHRADLVSPTGSGDVVQETPGEGIEDADITCSGSWVCGIVNLLRGTLIGQVRGQISGALGPISSALAQRAMPNPPGCPTGTTDRSGTCVYPDNSNVPTLLGTDGAGNFGALFASLSPGVRANVRYTLAAGDPMRDGQVINGGMSINMFGAMQSMAHNACVPRIAPPAIPTIPEYMALRANVVPGTSTPADLGIGIAEEYLNYSAYQLWDAGTLCLGVGTNLSQQISAGTFSILPALSSMRQLLFPQTTGPVAILLRPQQPPVVRIGRGTNVDTDPLLNIRLPRLALDFYAWSEERYVRFMTLTTDAVVGVNLESDAGGLRPRLGMLRTENISVSNNTLLSNNPALIGTSLQAILAPALGMLGGGLSPISIPGFDIPGSGGMALGRVQITIPPSGVQGVTEGANRFLGLFAGITFMPAGARTATVALDTAAALDGVRIDPSFFTVDGFRRENLPRVSFHVSTPNDFGHAAEYSWRLDRQTWSSFSTETRYEVQDFALASPGLHTIEVRARIAGEPESADAEPAQFTFIVDPVAPELTTRFDNDVLVAEATDNQSDALEYSFQFDGAPATEWGSSSRVDVPDGAVRIVVRVRDAAGNITERIINRQSLIRGGASTDASSGGCGCRVGSSSSSGGKGSAGLLGLFAAGVVIAARRRRRASAKVATALMVAATGVVASGCAEEATGLVQDGGNGDSGMPADMGQTVMCESGQNLCASSGMCTTPPACPDCMPGFGPMGSPTYNAATCAYDNASCRCERLPPLSAGSVGSHLHMAAAADGALWMSAYSPGEPNDGSRYGDLVVGRWNQETSSVAWSHVDGVPTNGMVTGDPMGWRSGVSTPGDDVGRFNSIAVNAAGQARVAYWDTTHDRLKYAAFNGTAWAAHDVDTNGSNGRYAALALLADGTPLIAYRAVNVAADGAVTAVVRLARGNSASPARASDWTIADAVTVASECRAADCPTGRSCVKSTGRCAPAGTCMATCGSGQACVGTTCQDVYDRNWVEDLPPGALFINLLVDGMGRPALVFYHRDRGNLLFAQGDASGRFAAPVILDGEGAMMRDGGDRGLSASAAMESNGTVHVAYVDGWEERLMYLRVVNGRPMGEPATIDDGSGVAAMSTFDDGRHIVGDGAAVSLGAAGPRVVYQDTTVGTLRLAALTGSGMSATWTRSVLDSMNHTGYWATVSGGRVGTYWRDLSEASTRRWGVRVFPLP